MRRNQFVVIAHKSTAQIPDYRFRRIGPSLQQKPDISPDDRWRIPMKYLIRVAFAALLATIAPVANAAVNFHSGSTIAGDAVATRDQQTGSYNQ
jgi:hypothetical protein